MALTKGSYRQTAIESPALSILRNRAATVSRTKAARSKDILAETFSRAHC